MQTWLIEEIERLMERAATYEEKAFYLALQELVMEQDNRLQSLSGQLDGTMWSPKDW